MRLIGKWLKAGVLEDGRLLEVERGTPRGAVISPVLATTCGSTSGGGDMPAAR